MPRAVPNHGPKAASFLTAGSSSTEELLRPPSHAAGDGPASMAGGAETMTVQASNPSCAGSRAGGKAPTPAARRRPGPQRRLSVAPPAAGRSEAELRPLKARRPRRILRGCCSSSTDERLAVIHG
ncbi:hypothetical protein PAHAL_9G203600 [Panicum hallii]|uniref:Uncharacterized protein n=1 Tax=Panicum hallii TaxID=206008 RepID=A0A2S3ILP4_9POAL|nr:hypothetical protein PAHAL_9G203600 [Panicum hallii]